MFQVVEEEEEEEEKDAVAAGTARCAMTNRIPNCAACGRSVAVQPRLQHLAECDAIARGKDGERGMAGAVAGAGAGARAMQGRRTRRQRCLE